MRAPVKKLVGHAFTLFFIAWATFIIIDKWEMLPRIQWDIKNTSLITLSVLIIVVLNSVLIEECAQIVGRRIGFAKSVAIGFIATSANYLLPMRGGLLIRLAAYARLAGHDAFVLGSVLTSSGLFTQFLLAGLLAILISNHVAIPYWYWILLAGAITASLSTYLAWPLIKRAKLHKYEFLRRVTEGSHLFYGNGGILALKTASVSMVVLYFTAARYIFIGEMLDPKVDIAMQTSLAIAAAAGISSMISITAGGFGVRESAIILIAGIFGVSPSVGLLFALIDRVLVTFIMIPLGAYSVLWAKKTHY